MTQTSSTHSVVKVELSTRTNYLEFKRTTVTIIFNKPGKSSKAVASTEVSKQFVSIQLSDKLDFCLFLHKHPDKLDVLQSSQTFCLEMCDGFGLTRLKREHKTYFKEKIVKKHTILDILCVIKIS